MTKENGLWNDTPNIFVAFLDIMGFREKIFREKLENVNKMFEALRPTIKKFEQEAKTSNPQLGKKHQWSALPISFSDSIIIFSCNDSADSAYDVVVSALILMSDAITNGIPMRGAIAFGEMIVDNVNSTYFGKPLIDAFELHEQLQTYGLVLHHTAQTRIEELRKAEKGSLLSVFDNMVFSYTVPMKVGKITHQLVDWTCVCEDPEKKVENFYKSVSGKPRVYVDNTLEFVRWITARKLELEQKNKEGLAPLSKMP